MSTEDLLEIVNLLRSRAEETDPSGAADERTGDFNAGMEAGLQFAIALIDDYFGPELDDERRAQEELEEEARS